MKSAAGAYMTDEDGNAYIDYINSWGPMILGHNHSEVVKAVVEQAKKAFSFGAPTGLEVEIAQLIQSMVPNIDMVRMVSSGTEACMSAVRLARGFTGRSKIIKFEGHYHGHADMFLKKAGSGVATLNIKQEGGIPSAVTDDTIVLPYNDFSAFEEAIAKHKTELAAVIVEPVAGNMGCVPPKEGYLQILRKLCTENKIVLIFDEVMTGFRLAKGGAQEHYNVWADLVTFGKIIGGGLPVGAFGGRKDIMSHLAPLGSVYQAGTLSGNPIAMTAGFTTLSILNSETGYYDTLNQTGIRLKEEMHKALSASGITHTINQLGSMISVHFCEAKVTDFLTASLGNNDTFKKFFHHMLDNGVYLPPSAFESWFVSIAIGEREIEKTIAACKSFRP
jgi:glutamate-1-semialdehyde 2,1-aminomutase